MQHFFGTYKSVCDKHDPTYYAKYKKWCACSTRRSRYPAERGGAQQSRRASAVQALRISAEGGEAGVRRSATESSEGSTAECRRAQLKAAKLPLLMRVHGR